MSDKYDLMAIELVGFISYKQNRDNVAAELRRMGEEIEQLRRGEYICVKCGLRHNDEYPKGDF